MTSIQRTAYPSFRKYYTDSELIPFRLSQEEIRLATLRAKGASQRLSFSCLLKSRQVLGYFPSLRDIPEQVCRYLCRQLNLPTTTSLLPEATDRKSIDRYREAIRKYLGSIPFSDEGQKLATNVIRKNAFTKSDPADLINAVISTLIDDNIEIPAFSTIDRLVGHVREAVHKDIYKVATDKLLPEDEQRLEELLVVRIENRLSDFNRLKQSPGSPTLSNIRIWAKQLEWLSSIMDPTPFIEGIAHTKIRQFAAEAAALELGDMKDIEDRSKRYTFLLCLLHKALVNTRDELVQMFIRRMSLTRKKAEEKLQIAQKNHRELEENMIGAFSQVLYQVRDEKSDAARGKKLSAVLESHGGIEQLIENYEKVSAYHYKNYLPFMWKVHVTYRAPLYHILDLLELRSSTQDNSLLHALSFIRLYRHSRTQFIPFDIKLDFASRRWQRFVQAKVNGEPMLKRQELEVCIFYYLSKGLNRTDIYILGSEEFNDYRTQMISSDEYEALHPGYCIELNIPKTGVKLAAHLKKELEYLAGKVDASFPKNTEFTIDSNGTPHLKRQGASPKPKGLREFQRSVRNRMPERHLLDILKNVQHWSEYTRHFSPPSGTDPKLRDAVKQYLFTVFSYGCNLGPSQTARHAPKDTSRQIIRRINAQHITVDKIEAATRDIIDEYVRFELPHFWGDSNIAVADGTHVPLRDNNLLAQRHFRYKKYGGIAYHHISSTYIALFSNFISCGVWEAVYILDGLLQNNSSIQPDTVHADTHGQTEPVFGLARLLGIKLFPRMKNWNDVIFYRSDYETRYDHIDSLFTSVIDWQLIETHYKDMMQVALSIQSGKVLPSMLLRKLGSHNRKNKLYQAFRELGRVERTIFLLRYISEPNFRRTIRAETTKVESYNEFLNWVSFGGPLIKTGDPVEQEKQIKYLNLVANAVMFHNVIDLTEVLNKMALEGFAITPEMLEHMSPYPNDNIRRFGQYFLDMSVVPDPLAPQAVSLHG